MKCDCTQKGCGTIVGFRGLEKERFQVATWQMAVKIFFACKKQKIRYNSYIRLHLRYLLIDLDDGFLPLLPTANHSAVLP